MTSIRTGLDSLRASLSFDLGCVLKSKTQKMLQTIRGMRSGRKVVSDCWMKMAITPRNPNTTPIPFASGTAADWSILLVNIVATAICGVYIAVYFFSQTTEDWPPFDQHTAQGVLNCDIKSHRIADEGVPVGLPER